VEQVCITGVGRLLGHCLTYTVSLLCHSRSQDDVFIFLNPQAHALMLLPGPFAAANFILHIRSVYACLEAHSLAPSIPATIGWVAVNLLTPCLMTFYMHKTLTQRAAARAAQPGHAISGSQQGSRLTTPEKMPATAAEDSNVNNTTAASSSSPQRWLQGKLRQAELDLQAIHELQQHKSLTQQATTGDGCSTSARRLPVVCVKPLKLSNTASKSDVQLLLTGSSSTAGPSSSSTTDDSPVSPVASRVSAEGPSESCQVISSAGASRASVEPGAGTGPLPGGGRMLAMQGRRSQVGGPQATLRCCYTTATGAAAAGSGVPAAMPCWLTCMQDTA
jgi:hypothetical protein